MGDEVPRGVGWPLLVEPGVIEGRSRGFVLPTGTVTFLLTDVEGSTRRWEAAPDAMSVAIVRHYELLDEAIAQHGGVRPVEQGEGDSVVGAFSRVSDAVAAALAAQRSFVSEPWPPGADLRVRMAIHTGEAQLRDDGNYVGQAIIRCARLRGIGCGGQVLLSSAAAALLPETIAGGAALRDLGVHRLRDLGRPEHVWQLVHPDLPADFDQLKSLDTFRHNLPVQLTPFVGRIDEIAELIELAAGERLVTLVGSAGVGKTRLALAVAAELLDRFPGGVWWVELAPLTDPSAIGRAALAALGATEVPGSPLVHQLGVELGADPSLVVLDNCEHLIAPCAELVATLLSSQPSVSVLTTSREPLGVPSEVTWRVPSMRCPGPEPIVSAPALPQYDAVALFADRAHRARPSFTVNDVNAAAIAQICQRLDGIPLAIELAAARCRQMSAERVAADLDDRFRYLTGGARTVMPRQQTLAASLDWSYDRLADDERRVFRRLAVFAGRFPLEAAEHVAAAPGDVDLHEVFELVSRLVDKSLVVADDGVHGQTRYRLLESLRAYAVAQARAADELPLLHDAHAAWWNDWLEPLWEMPSDQVLSTVEEFHDNLVVALDRSVTDPLLGLTLLNRLGRVWTWTSTGRASDAMVAVDRLLTDDNAARYGTVWLSAANSIGPVVVMTRGHAEAATLLEHVEHLAVEHGDEYNALIARRLWAPDIALIERLREMAVQRGDRYVELEATMELGSARADDDPVAAQPLLADVVRLVAERGSSAAERGCRQVMAMAARSTGDLRTCIDLSLSVFDDGSVFDIADSVNLMGTAALLAEDEHALQRGVDAAQLLRERTPGFTDCVETAVHRLDLLLGAHSIVDPEIAAACAAWPLTNATLWLATREAIDAGASEQALAGARALADGEPHGRAVCSAITAAATGDENAWHAALHIATDHDLPLIAVDAFEGLAAIAADAESWAEALRLLASAQRLRDETEYRWRFRREQSAVDTARDLAMSNLDDADIERIHAEGAGLDWRTAAAYAQRARGERKRPSHGWASLTPTEQQVVALAAEGLTNSQIATRLLMGPSTVKTHLAHIFTKLGINTRAQLAAEATRRTTNQA